MSSALTTIEKTEISISVTRDILSQAFGVDNMDSVTLEDCIFGYKQTEAGEAYAIEQIKKGADHNRGMYIEGIKLKEPDSWADIIRKKLGVARTRANQLSKFFRDTHSFEALINLKKINMEENFSKKSLSLEDLSFPATASELACADGLTKKERASINHELIQAEYSKEKRELIVEQTNLAKKAESYTKTQLDNMWSKIVDNGLDIRDDGTIYKYTDGVIYSSDKDSTDVVETEKDDVLIKTIQEQFNKFSVAMQKKSTELLSNPTKEEKWADLGWTEEDEELYQMSDIEKKSAKKVSVFFKDNYKLWKNSYKEIAKILHPDKGGSAEAQALMNAIGAEMSHVAIVYKYEDIIKKYIKIDEEYREWRLSQTSEIELRIEDFIEEIKNEKSE